MRTRLLLALLTASLLVASPLAAQTTADAKAIVAQAITDAAQQRKLVFVIFDASWCSNCRQFDRYLDSPDVHAILDQHFVVARISAMEQKGQHPERETPGAAGLLTQYGGGDGVPFFVFLDEQGGVVATSSAPKIGNIGFPVAPEEVDWWMKMLNKAVPSLTPDETKTLRSKLDRKQAAAH